MLSITELPRVDGVVTGDYCARHSSPSFSLEGFGFRFQGGVTGALRGRIADRLHAAYGHDVTFEPCDEQSAIAALVHMQKNRVPAARLAAVAGAMKALFSVAEEPAPAVVEPPLSAPPAAVAPVTVAPESNVGPAPASWAELSQLDVPKLRELCDAMSVDYDKRWGATKLRELLAEELDIEGSGQ